MNKLNEIIQKLNLLALEETTIYSGLFGYDGFNIKEYKIFYYVFNENISIDDNIKIMLNLLLNIIFESSNIEISDKIVFRDIEFDPNDYMLKQAYNLSKLYNFYDILDIINDAEIEDNILKLQIPIYIYTT